MWMVISQYHNLIYSSSTQFNADSKEKLFDNNFTNNGVWQLSQYFSGGTYITNNNRYINVDYKGDWLVIKLPNPIVIKRFRFYPKSGNAVRAPHGWKFYGSNDGITFTEIVEAWQAASLTTATDYSLGYYERALTALTTPYFYYSFTVGLLGIMVMLWI